MEKIAFEADIFTAFMKEICIFIYDVSPKHIKN